VGAHLSRRQVLKGGVLVGVALFGAAGRRLPAVAVPLGVEGPTFLREDERETLRAVVDVIVPADLDPGAAAAGCAEAIDGLLGAFLVAPPRIFAGGPFSDRGGASVNDFARFLPLDPYEERGWRVRIEGSGGDPTREFNGPVPGFQRTYRDGLAACERQAGPLGFAALPSAAREAILRSGDPDVDAMVDLAAPHTNEFLYGPPEYGGNRQLVGWEFTRWMGDVQPRGFTDDEVTDPELEQRQLPLEHELELDPDLLRLAGIATAENSMAAARSGATRLRDAQALADRARAAAAAYDARRVQER
jgi:hypothetical protein